jgi:hypothetical protein
VIPTAAARVAVARSQRQPLSLSTAPPPSVIIDGIEHENLQYKIVMDDGQDTEVPGRVAGLELGLVDIRAKSRLRDSVRKPVHAVVQTAPEAALREHDVHAIPDDGVGRDSKVRWGLRLHHIVGMLVSLVMLIDRCRAAFVVC